KKDGEDPGRPRGHTLRRDRRRSDGDHHGACLRRARCSDHAIDGPGRAGHALQPRARGSVHAERRPDPRQGEGAGRLLGRANRQMASVKMPQLGESITEGTIAKWLKQPGDQVKKYEGLVEIITDKVNAEVPAPLAGILKEIKVKEGATVTVGTEIAVIEESVTATPASSAPPSKEIEEVQAAFNAPEAAAPVPVVGPSSEGRTRLSPAV